MKSLPFRLVLAALALSLLFITPSVADAGPWTRSAGEYYVKVGNSYYRATSFRRADGLLISGTDYLSNTTYTYAEVGIWDDLHLQAYLPLVYSRTVLGEHTHGHTGFGDSEFSLQASPVELPFPTSIRLSTKLPLYGQPATPQTPARGDQQVDLTLWLSAGGSLYPNPLYFYVDVGYRHRTDWTFDDTVVGDFADSFVYFAQVGYTLFDTATVALNSSAVLPLAEDQISASYITVGPSLFWPVTDLLAIEADGYVTPYSRNSAAGWALGLGVSLRN